MAKKVILHVGTPKTGTTALQVALSTNSSALLEQGFHYPKHEALFHWNGHHIIPQKIVKQYHPYAPEHQKKMEEHTLLDALSDEIKAHNETVIISSEFFWMYSLAGVPSYLRKILDQHQVEIEIVVYLRRPDKYLISWYQQSCSAGWEDRHFEEWLIPHLAGESYEPRLNEWANHFGDKAIKIRLYDREKLKDGNVAADFLSLIGANIKLGTTGFDENTTPSPEKVEFGRLLKENTDLNLDQRMKILGKINTPGTSGKKNHSAEAYSVSILKFYEPNIRAMANRFDNTDLLDFLPRNGLAKDTNSIWPNTDKDNMIKYLIKIIEEQVAR